jgi:hypothetical protein
MELDQSYVWITTRRLKPGTREEFSRAWRPRGFPEGMLRAYGTAPCNGALCDRGKLRLLRRARAEDSRTLIERVSAQLCA